MLGRVAGARAGAMGLALVILLAGATGLAFFSGGYFDAPRESAGLVVWALVVIALLGSSSRRLLPGSVGGRLTFAGLALFAGWTLVSFTWAPVAGDAYHAGEIVFLYLGVLVAAYLLTPERPSLRTVEPGLALGAIVVIGYGISERLLPGLLHFQRSVSAQGRLEQPLTYWNAMGEVAALGFVLCTRLAGDRTRASALRATAAAATVPLGMGLYITFSRGALFACAAGLVALIVAARSREQLWGLVVTVAAGALASLAAAPFAGVTSLAGSLATRERQGAIVLAVLVVLALAAALAQRWTARAGRPGELRMPPHSGIVATTVICAGLGLAIVAGAKEASGAQLSGSAARLTTLQSNRYAYWGVAWRAFTAEPLRGVGAGGWQVYWLRYRSINDFAADAHSLPMQTLAELGLVGLALLAVFLAGVGLSARDAGRRDPSLAAGLIAGFVTYIAHAPLDWDWQMPAVTIIAMVLAGALVSAAQCEPAAIASVMASERVDPQAALPA